MNFGEKAQFIEELTGSLNFSFAILPPPEVDWFSVDQCDETPIRDGLNESEWYVAYTSCNVSGQGLGLMGRNLFANVSIGNATLGWIDARINSDVTPDNRLVFALLPLSPLLQPEVLYDVRVVNEGGEFILPRRLSFSNFSLVAAVERCSSRGAERELGCGPGDVITVRGAHFIVSPQTVTTVTITSSEEVESPVSANCSSVAVIDSSTLTCVLPYLATQSETEELLGYNTYVQATFTTINDSGSAVAVATNALPVPTLFVEAGYPYLTAVQGCGQQLGPWSLGQCQSGDVVTLEGAHLDLSIEFGGLSALSPAPFVDNANEQGASFILNCRLLNATNSTEGPQLSPAWLQRRQCQLPVFNLSDAAEDGLVQLGVTYQFYLAYTTTYTSGGRVYPVYYTPTSAFDVLFTAPNAPAIGEATSSELSAGAVAGIVLGVLVAVAVAVLLAVVAVRRWRASSKQAERGQNVADDRVSSPTGAGSSSGTGRGGGWWRQKPQLQGENEAYQVMELESRRQ